MSSAMPAEKAAANSCFLPDPHGCGMCITNDPACINEDLTFQEYKVYVRLVGQPNTKIGVTTCAGT